MENILEYEDVLQDTVLQIYSAIHNAITHDKDADYAAQTLIESGIIEEAVEEDLRYAIKKKYDLLSKRVILSYDGIDFSQVRYFPRYGHYSEAFPELGRIDSVMIYAEFKYELLVAGESKHISEYINLYLTVKDGKFRLFAIIG